MPDELTSDTFAPHAGTTFEIALAEGDPIALELTEVASEQPVAGAPRADPFRLVFQGPPERPLEQQTYELEHAALGTVAIFLVPIGPGTYEAIFN